MQELPLKRYRFTVSQAVHIVGDVQELHPSEQGVHLLVWLSAKVPTGHNEEFTHVYVTEFKYWDPVQDMHLVGNKYTHVGQGRVHDAAEHRVPTLK